MAVLLRNGISSVRPYVRAYKSTTEGQLNFKFGANIPPHAWLDHFEQKGQRSRSHRPTKFSNRRRVIIDKKSAAEMWLWDFPDAGKTRAWVSTVCKGAWLLLRSEFHDTLLYEPPAQG